jgi:hypothetical protein
MTLIPHAARSVSVPRRLGLEVDPRDDLDGQSDDPDDSGAERASSRESIASQAYEMRLASWVRDFTSSFRNAFRK